MAKTQRIEKAKSKIVNKYNKKNLARPRALRLSHGHLSLSLGSRTLSRLIVGFLLNCQLMTHLACSTFHFIKEQCDALRSYLALRLGRLAFRFRFESLSSSDIIQAHNTGLGKRISELCMSGSVGCNDWPPVYRHTDQATEAWDRSGSGRRAHTRAHACGHA